MPAVDQSATNRSTHKGKAILDLEDRIVVLEGGGLPVGSISTAELEDGVLSADAAGRLKTATDYFDETTVDAKFAAGSIDAQDRLKAASVITDRLAGGAVTGAKMGAGLLSGFFTAGNGVGARTLTGAVVGQRVLTIANLTTPGALGTPADFESAITVNDQIQQAATDHTGQDFLVLLLPASA